MIEYRIGDIFKQPDLDGWVHQANCYNTMGSGIAKSVKELYPEVYNADCETEKGDLKKLGSFSFSKTHDGKIGYNLYGQYKYGNDKRYTDYIAVETGLIKIREHVKSFIKPDAKIGIPFKMGCCRGGGDWNEVLKIINNVFENSSIDIVICQFNEYSQESDDVIIALRKSYKKFCLMGENE